MRSHRLRSSLVPVPVPNLTCSCGLRKLVTNRCRKLSRTLSRNKLNGTIPESLTVTCLPNLINLLLDSNNLSGQIPQSLFEIPKYNFTANNLNCGGGQPHPCASEVAHLGDSRKPKTGIIVGVVAGVTVILFGILLFLFCKDRHKDKGYKRDVFVDVAGEVDWRIAFWQLKRFPYPSHQQDAKLSGAGEFQCYNKHMISSVTTNTCFLSWSLNYIKCIDIM